MTRLIRLAGRLSRLRHVAKVPPVVYGLVSMALITGYFTSFASGANLFIFDSILLAGLGAIALNLAMGTAGQVSIGVGGFLAIGTFSSVFFLRSGIGFPLDTVLAVLVSAAAGGVIAVTAIRLRGVYVALSTLALQVIAVFLAREYQSRRMGPAGFVTSPLFSGKGIDDAQRYWGWTLFVTLALVVLLVSRLVRHRAGRAWRLVREHDQAAGLLGISVQRYKVSAFAISSAVTGLQGSLTLHFTGSASYDTFTLLIGVQYMAMIVIGGLDSIGGALVGAALLTALPTLLTSLMGRVADDTYAVTNGGAVTEIVYGVLLVVFVVGARDGIVGVVKWGSRWVAGRARVIAGARESQTSA
jgi:branched-chain amino acid transport system permease protein